MPTPRRSVEECALWVQRVKQAGSVSAAARLHGMPVQTVQSIIGDARTRDPECLPPPLKTHDWASDSWSIPARPVIDVAGRSVLTGGDLHRWPGPQSIAWRAFVTVAHEIKPDIIVLGGDILDGARVSRHARQFGSKSPRLTEELDAVRSDLTELPPSQRLWVIGNHDLRVDGYLANNAPELDDYAGSLRDRFPEWQFAYGFALGANTEIRHRFRGGIHASYNNTLHAGISICSFHTHQSGVRSFDDRNGRRYGIEPGCLADPNGPQFEYHEAAPSRSAMGFAVLSFDGESELMPPELCEHSSGRMIFRGRVVAGEKPRYRVRAGSIAA